MSDWDTFKTSFAQQCVNAETAMSEIKHTPGEAEAFDQWIEEYRKGKPYWSTARIEICRDTWMERAKRDTAPELIEALKEAIETIKFLSTRDNSWGEQIVCEDLQAIIAKATGSQS
jgi:hypothetical protein